MLNEDSDGVNAELEFMRGKTIAIVGDSIDRELSVVLLVYRVI